MAFGDVSARSQDHAGLEALRCHSPAMARKEMLAFLIATTDSLCHGGSSQPYDAIWSALVQGHSGCTPQYAAAISAARNQKMRQQLWQDLLLNLVRDQVRFARAFRASRVKRRPNPTTPQQPDASSKKSPPHPLLEEQTRKSDLI